MADPTPEEAAAPAKKRRLPLVVALAVLVIGAGGGAAWWFFGRGSAHEDAEAAAAKPAEPIYVALEPPFVVNFEAGGQVRFLQVAAQAMTRDAETGALIQRHDPMVRNALLLLLAGQSYESVATREGKEALRRRALDEVRAVVKALGGDGAKVEDLYFTSFVMQ